MKQHSLAILALLVGSGAIAMLILSRRAPDTASTAKAALRQTTTSPHSDMTTRLEEARAKSPLVSFLREPSSPSIDVGSRNDEAPSFGSSRDKSDAVLFASTSSRYFVEITAGRSQTQRAAASQQDAIDIIAPIGARLPAALVQTNEGVRPEAALNAVQQELADDLATEFAKEIARNDAQHPVSTETAESNADALKFWKNAAERADDRFRSLFGVEAYNRESIRQYQLSNQPTN